MQTMSSSSTPTFPSFGEKLYFGKLENAHIGDLPTPAYLGYIQMQRFPGLKFLYFRDYDLDNNDKPVFKDFQIDPDAEYCFNVGYLRIPPEFKYVYLDKEGNPRPLNQPLTRLPDKKDIRYFGLALFNMHIPVEDRNVENDSMVHKSYVLPDHHYVDVHPLVGGPGGCEPTVSFGHDKVPFFGKEKQEEQGEQKEEDIKIENYYLLCIGTENTVGFFEFKDEFNAGEANLKYFLIELEKLLDNKDRYEVDNYRIGIYLHNYLKYDPNISGFRYGVHIVKGGFYTDGNPSGGWKLGWYKPKRYDEL